MHSDPIPSDTENSPIGGTSTQKSPNSGLGYLSAETALKLKEMLGGALDPLLDPHLKDYKIFQERVETRLMVLGHVKDDFNKWKEAMEEDWCPEVRTALEAHQVSLAGLDHELVEAAGRLRAMEDGIGRVKGDFKKWKEGMEEDWCPDVRAVLETHNAYLEGLERDVVGLAERIGAVEDGLGEVGIRHGEADRRLDTLVVSIAEANRRLPCLEGTSIEVMERNQDLASRGTGAGLRVYGSEEANAGRADAKDQRMAGMRAVSAAGLNSLQTTIAGLDGFIQGSTRILESLGKAHEDHVHGLAQAVREQRLFQRITVLALMALGTAVGYLAFFLRR